MGFAELHSTRLLETTAMLLCHRFDGDGMMHVVRIKNGQASYCNRFVDTVRLQQEKAAGHPVSLKVQCLLLTHHCYLMDAVEANAITFLLFIKTSAERQWS